jgi:hypothetical protein
MAKERTMNPISAILVSTLLATAAYAPHSIAASPDGPAGWLDASAAVDALAPGEFEWHVAPASVQGPLVIVVSLGDQRAWVFRNGERVATSTVSTGKPGKETPTGVFPILAKKRVHHSNLYDAAPMPFMQRLTWDGIALHAGRIPGHPASHGCVRLPKEFARALFELTARDETVVISPDGRVASLLAVGLPEWQARQVGREDAMESAMLADANAVDAGDIGGDSFATPGSAAMTP